MAVASIGIERVRVNFYIPNLGFENFVAKIQKSKTRKGKDYFVSRITMPKEIANNLDAEPGEYVFFKVKKAEWFHMLEWDNMKSTWDMLPNEIKRQVFMDGLIEPGQQIHFDEVLRDLMEGPSATNPGGSYRSLPESMIDASRNETR